MLQWRAPRRTQKYRAIARQVQPAERRTRNADAAGSTPAVGTRFYENLYHHSSSGQSIRFLPGRLGDSGPLVVPIQLY